MSPKKHWKHLQTSSWSKNNTKAEAKNIQCFYDFVVVVYNSRLFHASNPSQRMPGWLLETALVAQVTTASPCHQEIQIRCLTSIHAVTTGILTSAMNLPILTVSSSAFTHFSQSRLGQQTMESVCPFHLPPHHWSLLQKLWSEAWKSINKWKKTNGDQRQWGQEDKIM